MAKQAGKYLIAGTIDELTFYKMDGKYYVRCKSTLCSKRVKKSKAFAGTMKSARELGTASRIASQVYRRMDKDVRHVSLYRKLTGIAKLLVKKGVDREDIRRELELYIATDSSCKATTKAAPKEIKNTIADRRRPALLKSSLYFSRKPSRFEVSKGPNRKTRWRIKSVFDVRNKDDCFADGLRW